MFTCAGGALAALLFAAPLAPATLAQGAAPERPYLGVQLNPEGDSVTILSVRPDSPAAKAGLEDGDVIREVGGTGVADNAALSAALGTHRPGEQVKLRVQRGDRTVDLVVELGKRPEGLETGAMPLILPSPEASVPAPAPAMPAIAEPEAPRKGGFLGVMAETADGGGARITEVREDSPAQRAKLKSGDVLVKVGEHPVGSVEELVAALGKMNAGDEVDLTVLRGDAQKTRKVTLGGPEALAGAAVADAPEAASAPEPAPAPEPRASRARLRAPVPAPAEPAPPPAEETSERGWLGVYYSDGEGGVHIDGTVDGSPAAKAGLAEGDLLVSVGDRRVASGAELVETLGKLPPGKKVTLGLRRGDEDLELKVQLGTRPSEDLIAEGAPGLPTMPAMPAMPSAPAPPEPPAMGEKKAVKVRAKDGAKKRSAPARTIEIPEGAARVIILKGREDGDGEFDVEVIEPGEGDIAADLGELENLLGQRGARIGVLGRLLGERAAKIRADGERAHEEHGQHGDADPHAAPPAQHGDAGGCCCCCCCHQGHGAHGGAASALPRARIRSMAPPHVKLRTKMKQPGPHVFAPSGHWSFAAPFRLKFDGGPHTFSFQEDGEGGDRIRMAIPHGAGTWQREAPAEPEAPEDCCGGAGEDGDEGKIDVH